MKIADVRVIQADIPVERPHKMSFTTLVRMVHDAVSTGLPPRPA